MVERRWQSKREMRIRVRIRFKFSVGLFGSQIGEVKVLWGIIMLKLGQYPSGFWQTEGKSRRWNTRGSPVVTPTAYYWSVWTALDPGSLRIDIDGRNGSSNLECPTGPFLKQWISLSQKKKPVRGSGLLPEVIGLGTTWMKARSIHTYIIYLIYPVPLIQTSCR